MSPFYIQLISLSATLAIAVAIGAVIPLGLSWSRHHLPAFLSLAAGVMLGAALLHLLPEAFELAPRHTALWILLGFLFLYAFEKFVTVHVCEALDCEVHTVGVSAFLGLAIHALTEGFALGSGLLSGRLGWIIFLSILLHKIPAALALTSILLHEQYRRRTILVLQLAFIAMVPLGAVMVQLLTSIQGINFVGIAVAFSVGTFLHISLSDLLPEVHRSEYRRSWAFLTFLLGLAFIVLLKYALPDAH